ncbi:MAG: TIGR00730 family Rossman fold protein [Actinomycetota bacterium]
MDNKRICVFCGSGEGNDPAYREGAEDLAREIVRRGYGVVYGGGLIGLMGAVARTALDLGAEVIGVIPRTLTEREVAFEDVTELHVVDSMHERKALMNELSAGFVALPGGYGTMEELFEVITWAQLGIHSKPFGLLDVNGFFDPLMAFLDHATREGFIREEYREMLRSSSDPSELLDHLVSWTAPEPISWLDLEQT